MNILKLNSKCSLLPFIEGKYLLGASFSLLLAFSAVGQTDHKHKPESDKSDTTLQEQLLDLQAEVARLKGSLSANHKSKKTTDSGNDEMTGNPAMKMGKDSKSMGGMEMKKGMKMGMDGMKKGMKMGMDGMKKGMKMGMEGKKMGEMKMDGMKMGMMGKKKGMEMMGMMKKMGGSSGMQMPTALPGFPGASHLYHIGSTGFFLDHGEHLELTDEQQSKLNKIKQGTALSQATSERKIEEAEQELWQLTASSKPDAKDIEAKIREIEKLRGDQRIAFIRSVGKAANTLTHKQYLQLSGTPKEKSTEDHSGH